MGHLQYFLASLNFLDWWELGAVLALADVFLALTVLFLGCVGLAALMRRPVAAGGPGGGH